MICATNGKYSTSRNNPRNSAKHSLIVRAAAKPYVWVELLVRSREIRIPIASYINGLPQHLLRPRRNLDDLRRRVRHHSVAARWAFHAVSSKRDAKLGLGFAQDWDKASLSAK
jgi:hypothetical protein